MWNNERTRTAAAQIYSGAGKCCRPAIPATKKRRAKATMTHAIPNGLFFLMRQSITGIMTSAIGLRISIA